MVYALARYPLIFHNNAMEVSANLSEFLPYLLSVTSNAVSAQIAEQYQARFGLKITEWRIVAVLGDSGPHTQRDLASLTLMDKVAVNRACKALVERDLVSRSPNAEDGRSHRLDLTEEGRQVFVEVMPLALEMEEQIFAGFDETERARLKTMLRRIGDSVSAID